MASTLLALLMPFAASLLLSDAALSAGMISVSPHQSQRLGIRTAPVRPAGTQASVSILGRVTPAPDSRRPVSVPFAGSVISFIRLEGEMVKKGEALAVIASSEMSAGMARLQGLEAQDRMARAAAQRAHALMEEGIAPAARAEEADAEAAMAAAQLSAARIATARARRAEDGGYHLLAPEAGRIASVEAKIGDQLVAMQPLMTIDIREEFWVEGALPAAAVGRVSRGDTVRIENDPDAFGEVVAAGASIDPQTRSATLRARLTAPGGLVSGQTVRLTVERRAAPGSFNVPRAAVVELDKGPAVFIARSGGFEAVPVRVLARGPAEATVSGALRAQDHVAIAGMTELKAAHGKQ